MKLSDEKIQDYVDRRLSERERAVVAAILAGDPELRDHVAALLRTDELVRGLGQTILDEPIPDRLYRALRSGEGDESAPLDSDDWPP